MSCMYMYIYIHIHKHTHTYIYIYIHISTYIYTYTCIIEQSQIHVYLRYSCYVFGVAFSPNEPNCTTLHFVNFEANMMSGNKSQNPSVRTRMRIF